MLYNLIAHLRGAATYGGDYPLVSLGFKLLSSFIHYYIYDYMLVRNILLSPEKDVEGGTR